MANNKTIIELFPEIEKMPIFSWNWFSTEKINVNQGGMYSGKSHALVRVCLLHAIFEANCIVDIVSSSVPKLKEDTMRIFNQIVENNPWLRHCFNGKFNKSDRSQVFKNGSVLSFKSYENSEQAEGAKRDYLYINEAKRVDWATAYLLIKRTNKKVYIDYNPTMEFWVHDNIVHCPVGKNGNKEFGSVQVIRSNHWDNHFLTQQQHDDIENISDPELYKAYAKGFTARLTGLVFPNFEQVLHFPKVSNNIWGMDLGYTNDPTVITKIALPSDGRFFPGGFQYIGKELCYATGLNTGAIYDILNQNGYRTPEPLYMDHDETMRKELRSLGVNAIHAIKGPGSLESSILHVRTKKVGYIGENSKIAFKRYSFAMKDGKVLNIPAHAFSHCPDAYRYPIFSHAIRTGEIRNEYTEEQQEAA